MTTVASQITSLIIVYSTVYSDTDQRKHQSSASLAFVWAIHRDRWIPRTKGQLRGFFFHLMTSSWESQQTPIPLTLTSELWGVYCEDFGENWPRYIGTALYNFTMWMVKLYVYIYIWQWQSIPAMQMSIFLTSIIKRQRCQILMINTTCT